jgi:rSAM/selenodomain-associated transferase 2
MRALSIIVPVLDEETRIGPALLALAPLRARGAELIVADGGSRDRTVEIARALCDRVIVAPRGRGAQMNAGAAAATGAVLLFLHGDVSLPPEADALVLDGLRDTVRPWGRFDVWIEGRSRLLPLISSFMNWRSRLTGIVTGDQAMFVTHAAFEAAGRFPDIALMEDIELSRRLKAIHRPLCLTARVVASGRRFDERGAIRMMMLMWRLRLEFWLGVSPATLARRYGYVARD